MCSHGDGVFDQCQATLPELVHVLFAFEVFTGNEFRRVYHRYPDLHVALPKRFQAGAHLVPTHQSGTKPQTAVWDPEEAANPTAQLSAQISSKSRGTIRNKPDPDRQFEDLAVPARLKRLTLEEKRMIR